MYIQIYWFHHVMICDPGKVGNRNSIQGEFEMVLLKREIHVRAHLFRELAYLFCVSDNLHCLREKFFKCIFQQAD